jgi:TniQ
MDTIQPLPVRLEPQPWEELTSFLTRTAHHMQYQSIAWILQPELLPFCMTSRNLSLLTAQQDYTFLAALLALSEDQIYQMTLHSWDVLSRHLSCFPPFHQKTYSSSPSPHTLPDSTSLGRPLLTRQVYQFTCLPTQTTQICARCLQEPISYDRLYWKMKYLLTCPKHQVLLQRSCGYCHRPILSTRMNPQVCHVCHHAYQNTSLEVPEELSFLLQGDLLTLHALGISQPHPFPRLENDPRTLLPFEQYFALLRALSLSMRYLHVSDFQMLLPAPILTLFTPHRHQPLTPQERIPPLHIATIHWIFAHWPDHFFTFISILQALRREGQRKAPFSFLSLPSTFRTQAPQATELLQTTPRRTTPKRSTRLGLQGI